MKNLFERTSSNWARYNEYEWKAAKDGTLFLTPAKTAQPSIYDPLSEYQRIALYAGRQRKADAPLQTLYAGVCGKQTECDLLQPAV